ncbi:MAG: hypothetical protein L0Z47_01575, partial [Actinobacteria bacterium]|nr:hypothetical protein [Actinomycetota bacterium]
AARTRLIDPTDPRFALQAALLAFIVVVHADPRRAVAGAVIAIVGLAVRGLIVKPWFWWMVTALMTVWYLWEWPLLDNHVALSVYWAGAVGISLTGADWRASLASLGRWMIVVVFTLAVFWKVVSPEFLDGRFFEWTLVVDPRFVPLASGLGMDTGALEANRALVASGMEGSLAAGAAIPAAAQILTWGTLVVESAVAALWALGERVGVWRHLVLALFAVITYVIVPVAGFGFMLLVMGVATVTTTKARLAYALGAVALIVYSTVWTSLVLG